MGQPGSRTTSTDLCFVDEDAVAFDVAVRQVAPALWRCSQPGPPGAHQVHLHATLPEALTCGGVQAFLSLPFGATAGESLALVQYLTTHRRPSDSMGRVGDHLKCGWLAVRWYKDEVGDAEPLLVEQRRAVWRAMRSASQPCLLRHLHTDATHKSARIGRAAFRLVQEQRLPLILGSQPYRLAED